MQHGYLLISQLSSTYLYSKKIALISPMINVAAVTQAQQADTHIIIWGFAFGLPDLVYPKTIYGEDGTASVVL